MRSRIGSLGTLSALLGFFGACGPGDEDDVRGIPEGRVSARVAEVYCERWY
jgi:hypothetical protein